MTDFGTAVPKELMGSNGMSGSSKGRSSHTRRWAKGIMSHVAGAILVPAIQGAVAGMVVMAGLAILR